MSNPRDRSAAVPPCPQGASAARFAVALRAVMLLVALLPPALLAPAPATAQLRGSLGEGRVGEGGPEPVAPSPAAAFRIRPVDGAPAAPGVRRVIQTFAEWTLICDEARRGRVCNASQSILAPDGTLAFSWSLAATKGGEPVFLVRAPVTRFPSHTVTLGFGPTESVIRLDACDARLCVGFLPLTPDMVGQIRKRGRIPVRYFMAEGTAPVEFAASLDGLGAAISSIR